MSDSIADELLRVVAFSSSQLRDIDIAVVADRPAPDRWSIKQVLGHLIDSACNNHQRFVRAQEAEALVFPAYDQNHWVDVQHFDDVDWEQLVDLWKNYNKHLAHVLRNVPASAHLVPCTIGQYETVTLHFLMNDYVVHLKHHLRKIAERAKISPEEMGC